MKLIFTLIGFFGASISTQAQQISTREISSNIRFNKQIEEFNNGTEKIRYADIKGIPYYYPEFINAKIGDTKTSAPIRYNSFLDTIELINNEDVYQLPKEESNPSFTLETTKEKLVYVKTEDLYSGYFFELNEGKFRILKKIITKYQAATPPPNPMIAGNPAIFMPQKPIYFIKGENIFIKINNSKELAEKFPDKKISEFISKNKIKLSREADLIQLGNFLNQ
jgi:hypothetical protein